MPDVALVVILFAWVITLLLAYREGELTAQIARWPVAERRPDPSHQLVLYQMAQNDIVWAKSHMWQAANWNILAQAAIGGLSRLDLVASASWVVKTPLLGILAATVGILGTWYVARLHDDIVDARLRATTLARELEIFGYQVGGRALAPGASSPDQVRGITFAAFLVTTGAAALAIDLLYIGAGVRLAIGIALTAALAGTTQLAVTAHRS